MKSQSKISDEDFIELYNKMKATGYGYCGRMAKELGLNPSSITRRVAHLSKTGLIALESGAFVGEGQILKGTSDYYKFNEDTGKLELKNQWVKTDVAKEDSLRVFDEALDLILQKVPKRKKTKIKDITSHKDTMTVYSIGDAHIGMLAWDKETGADNDLETVQADLLSAMSLLVSQSNPSEEAFIIDVGDWFHSDNHNNTTSNSGNHLDVDGRYPKVLQIGLDITIKLIDMALTKHHTVRWRSAIGNHNEHSAVMMTAFIKAWYRNEPRVIIHDTPNMFMYHQFGKNLVGVTHGHTCKAEKLGEIMSVDCEEIWSESKYRYWYTGHVHHQSIKEFSSCVVETFRTLAGKDAWHSASGYRSGQSMVAITLHKDYGEVSRNTASLSMVRARRVK